MFIDRRTKWIIFKKINTVCYSSVLEPLSGGSVRLTTTSLAPASMQHLSAASSIMVMASYGSSRHPVLWHFISFSLHPLSLPAPDINNNGLTGPWPMLRQRLGQDRMMHAVPNLKISIRRWTCIHAFLSTSSSVYRGWYNHLIHSHSANLPCDVCLRYRLSREWNHIMCGEMRIVIE